jgi:hypothetical protein
MSRWRFASSWANCTDPRWNLRTRRDRKLLAVRLALSLADLLVSGKAQVWVVEPPTAQYMALAIAKLSYSLARGQQAETTGSAGAIY